MRKTLFLAFSIATLIGTHLVSANGEDEPVFDGGSPPIYCIAPAIESVRIFEWRDRIFVEFDIFPLQRTHIWDDLNNAEALGFASVSVGGQLVPAQQVSLSKQTNQSWQFVRVRADITEFFFLGAEIVLSAFHKSDGNTSCRQEKKIRAPFNFFEIGSYNPPSLSFSPTEN